jgi:hypothetical protein
LIPQATPAAVNPFGSPGFASETLAGACTQRERKNEPVAVT